MWRADSLEKTLMLGKLESRRRRIEYEMAGWHHWLNGHAAAPAKSHQSCPTLCDPTDDSPLGSPVPGILQARTLEWVAISFSSAWQWKVKVKLLSRVRLLATPWIAAYQAPPSMGFSRQECWSGVPSTSPDMSLANSRRWEGQVSLECCSPWIHKEMDTTEWLSNRTQQKTQTIWFRNG